MLINIQKGCKMAHDVSSIKTTNLLTYCFLIYLQRYLEVAIKKGENSEHLPKCQRVTNGIAKERMGPV
jgi:hypothetical protein